MQFLHFEVNLAAAANIRVDLAGSEANVKIMDDQNFRHYRELGRHQYFGGHYKSSPAIIGLPSGGKWHVVVDTGGYAGRVTANVRVI